MKPEQRQRIINRHRDSLTRHGHHPHALYWSSREIQEIRFQVLATIGITSASSLLDVGCGFGDFNRWLNAQGIHTRFTGVDLSPDLIAVAREQHPTATFHCGELFDIEAKPQAFDWLTLSGALNEQLFDHGDYARRTIAYMFKLCRYGVAFNLLDARHLRAHDLQSFEPETIYRYCQTLCDEVTLIDDYLDNDFTIYMRKRTS